MLNLLYFIVLCFVCVKTNNIGVIHSNLFKKFIDELSRELYFTFNSSSPPEWGGQDSNQRGDQTFPPGIQTGSSQAPIVPELSRGKCFPAATEICPEPLVKEKSLFS